MTGRTRRAGATGWTRVAAAGDLEVWRGPGEGRPLVAAHGMEDAWSIWGGLTGRLEGFTPYALRLPWRGGNAYRWREEATPGEWLRRALALVPEAPEVLLGHSFGANSVLDYLATEEEVPGLKAVVLYAPFYRPADFDPTPALRLRSRAALRKVIREGFTLALGPRAASLDPDLRIAMGGKLLDRVMPAGFPVFYEEFIASGLLDLTRVTTPTLVLAGVDDESLTPMRAAALARAMPAATVRLRSSYGHFCHVAQPAALSGETAAFLRRALRPAAEPPTGPFEGEPTMSTELLDDQPTSYVGSPRYEGVNIRTWVGFKHFMYLVEEAVLAYFRERGVGARDIYHRHGLGLEIVDSSVQLPATLEAEDQVYATIISATPKPGKGAPFTVTLNVERDGRPVTVLKGKVRVALVAVKDGSGTEPVPAVLEPYVVPEVAALTHPEAATLPVGEGREVADVLVPEGSGAYLWSWRAPYTYCHFSDRLQHSAYVRTLEEVVDRFLHDRGIAIGRLLEERAWIPVVSRARVQMLADVFMEETVHTVFQVQDVIKDTVYTARMDCYVRRGDGLERVATATIMHGYAVSRGEKAGTVAVFDDEVRAVLTAGRASA
ncbi:MULTISPECIES: serine aminopeptidase domain-containing protein [Streptomyces]|uniref:serine aminopeptidase domain-containing protein n=1 Tax=Streptomyces TaxID=1883 RepID=UPI00163B62E0|nr:MULTISPECIES: alpha/beta hydrolase [Streptomyces]MBC2875748.1 alpha/beta hydrolase [Streptomyces sp. TYQ1024]UBI37601.1 alpha/beta hydrolase [Streptomyces mobaraensis]UKW30189.1 alpha/beta hydrolase [Streptomyces sp. TYQ1024]